MIPEFEWYSSISARHRLPPRCPFASVERCPRYYQSVSLLGEAGSTRIEPAEDERLKRMWEGSDLWPRTAEYATAVSGPKDEHGEWKHQHFSNFCPEVAYDRFGYFASYLGSYAVEIDRDFAHQRLGEAGASRDEWRWAWAGVQPMHYTECPLYSPLVYGGGFPTRPDEVGPEFKLEVLGASVRFKFSWREMREWCARRLRWVTGVVQRP